MRTTLALRASQARQPMIKFIGKRQSPQSLDHTPQPHPASPTHSLPDSFASYRDRVQQHGPIGRQSSGNGNSSPASSAAPKPSSAMPTSSVVSAMPPYGPVGGRPGKSLGSVKPKDGEFFDRSELPARFRRMAWTDAEMDAVTSGGATMFG